MNSAHNSVLYDHGSNRITSTQAIVDGKTYNLSDIATASILAPVLRREYGYVLAAIGMVLLVVGYLVWGAFLTPMLAGAVLLIAGIAIAIVVRKSYIVLLKHRNAQLTKLQFPERAQAEQFMQALNQAINQAS
jgi:hypothetical protein